MASEATLTRHGMTEHTIGQLVCLFCKHGGTLLRVKPAKSIYACRDCVRSRGGIEACHPLIAEAVRTFHERKAM